VALRPTPAVAFCKDFDDTMAKFNVPEAHKELFAIVESTKGDIVSKSS
jgi:hypothetical protein